MNDVPVDIGYRLPASPSSPQAHLRATMPYPPYQGASTNIMAATVPSHTISPEDLEDDDESQDEFEHPFSEDIDADAEGEPEDIEPRVQQPAGMVQTQPMSGVHPMGHYPPPPFPGTASIAYNSPQPGYTSQAQNYHLSHPTAQYTQYYTYHQSPQPTSQLSAPAHQLCRASLFTIF